VKEHFIRLRVGLLEHFEDGRVTPTMANCFTVVLGQADYATGFWKGSAAKIFAAWGGQLSLRTIQDALSALYGGGYLKSFHKHGQRGNYYVAINKYLVKMGSHKGYVLNASATTAPENPVYELPEDGIAPVSVPPQRTDCPSHCPPDCPKTPLPNARIQEVREAEKDFREGSQSQSPDLDARLPASTPSKAAKSKAKAPSRERLEANLREKIEEAGNCFRQDMDDEQRKAFAELEYEPDLDSPLLTTHFIDAVVDVVADNFFHERCPANLCSEVIDRCQEEIDNGEPAYWPPDFEKHRDRLQKAQREAERKVTGTATMAAAAGRGYTQLPRSDR